MFLGLVTVILVDVILFLVIGLAHAQWKQKNERVPLSYAVTLFALCCVGHFAATKTMGQAAGTQAQARLVVLASAGFGFLPIWAYVHMLCSRIAEEAEVRRDTFPKAHRRRVAGDIEGALLEYLRYYEADPGSPAPLFGAAGMFELEKDYRKAATVFRQIMDRFEKDDRVWTKAAQRLVSLRAEHLGDTAGAAALRAQIEKRTPAK